MPDRSDQIFVGNRVVVTDLGVVTSLGVGISGKILLPAGVA
jgi:hypothetical protein